MYLINGQPHQSLDAADRGLQFGDGCFTTARIIDGQVRFLSDHLVRLRRDAARLRIAGVHWRELRSEMMAQAAEAERGVLKVILTRGSGGRGYAPEGAGPARRILKRAPWPAHYDALRARGVRLATSQVPLGCNRWLAGIKHLNRLEQVLIRSQLEQTMADEALVLDSAGMLVECCAANLFWRQGRRIFTPDLSHSGVEGTLRRHVMRTLRANNRAVEVVRVAPSALEAADEVVICNALMPVLAVTAIDERPYRPGELYEFLSPRCE